jgi:hypothetical protein
VTQLDLPLPLPKAPCSCCGFPVTGRGSQGAIGPLLCVICHAESRERSSRTGSWVTGQFSPDQWEIDYE